MLLPSVAVAVRHLEPGSWTEHRLHVKVRASVQALHGMLGLPHDQHIFHRCVHRQHAQLDGGRA